MADAIKVDEIEITPQMIEAGVDELKSYSLGEPLERIAEGVFMAMFVARDR